MDKYQTRTNRIPGRGRSTPNQAPHAVTSGAFNDSGHDSASQTLAHATRTNIIGAVALACGAVAMSLLALDASAEITEDCILEGTVDMRMAEQLGQPVYVRFRNAERGSEARCSLNRRSNSRRVQFISSPDEHDLDDAGHGDRVRYRYTERDGNPGSWQLIEVSER